MSDDHQPETVRVAGKEKKRDRGRVWLIIALVIFAVAIICVPLYFLLMHDVESEPTSSTPASPAPTSAPTTSDQSAEPDPDPTQPAVPDPDLETFIEQVQPRLDDAARGLQLVTDNIDLGSQIVDSLQQDATVLSDTAAPSSIADDWSSAVSQYASALNDLRGAYDKGTDPQAALDAASTTLQKVRAIVGL